MEAGEVEWVGGEVKGGQLAGEWVALMVAPWMRFWLLPSRVSCVLLCNKKLCVLGWLPPTHRKRAAVQRPETVGTYLMLGLVDTIYVHTINKPVCPCRVKRGRDWPSSALFGRGRAISGGRRGCMGSKMIPPHIFDRWALAQHTRCGADMSMSRIYWCHHMLSRHTVMDDH